MINQDDLIVSCQALEDEPLHSSFIMGRMAIAAVQGGANGIRANSVADILEIKKHVDVPIIGIIKQEYPNCELHITVTMEEIDKLVAIKTDIIAMDATNRLRPNGEQLSSFVQRIKAKYPQQKLMADCSTIEEMIQAANLGFDYIGTTLFGYTNTTTCSALEDDAQAISEAAALIKQAIIAEGNVNTPQLAKLALEKGAYAVVVGSMITRPQIITSKFKEAMNTTK